MSFNFMMVRGPGSVLRIWCVALASDRGLSGHGKDRFVSHEMRTNIDNVLVAVS